MSKLKSHCDNCFTFDSYQIYYRDVIRDVDWHPNRNEIATSSFDGRVNISTYKEKVVRIARTKRDLNSSQAPRRRSRRIAQQRANQHI